MTNAEDDFFQCCHLSNVFYFWKEFTFGRVSEIMKKLKWANPTKIDETLPF